MTDEFKTNERRPEESPWPIPIALGITLSEIGVLLGFRPLSVGGLLLFIGTIAGITYEAGYVDRPERAIGIQGVALIGIGLVLITVNHIGSTVRGQSITIAGAISLLAVPLWLAYTRT